MMKFEFGSEEYKKICNAHQTICNFAGLQIFENTDIGSLLYLEAEVFDEPTEGANKVSVIKLNIKKDSVYLEDASLNKEDVLDALNVKMGITFPEYAIETSGFDLNVVEDAIQIQEHRVSNKVAQQTRRGKANTKFLDFLYYKSTQTPGCAHAAIDTPFIVYKFGDKYGIWRHPKAALYGYRLVKE